MSKIDTTNVVAWQSVHYGIPIDETHDPAEAQKWLDSGVTVRALYTSPQPSNSLTDDPLQGAVDWLLQADGEYFCTATVQRTLRIGYNRAKRLCDTAKERAAHGITGEQK